MAEQEGKPAAVAWWREDGAISRANRIDDWLSIDPDGTVNVCSGKVELGTGVRTALAQIVAEELDVPLERIRMTMGDTRLTPDEGLTVGSMTVRFGGYSLRHASAEARSVLLELASRRLGAPVGELVVVDGSVQVASDRSRSVSYAELLGGKGFRRAMSGKARPKKPEHYRIVGKAAPRVELPRKFTGASSFVHDVKIPGMLHARVVRPPAPMSELLSLDADSASEARVVRVGKAFVAVVAEREEEAMRASQRIKVQWRTTNVMPPMERIFDELLCLPAEVTTTLDRGNVDEAIASAAVRHSASYRQPYQSHASVGPSCAVADYSGGSLTVWSSTQGVYLLRQALSDLLGIAPDRVRVIHAEGPGCYGQNGADDVAADAALLSREVGRPVRVLWSRGDEFGWEPHGPAMLMEVSGALDGHGRLIGWRHEVWSPSHGERPRIGADLVAGQLVSGTPAPERSDYIGGDRNAPIDYACPNERVVLHSIRRSPLRNGSLRSLGAFANAFANESFMDELAHAAGADPVKFRLDHLDDPRARAVVERAAERAGWGSALSAGEGLGVAFSRYENTEAYVATVARVHVDRESGRVSVRRFVTAHDCGLIINPDGLRNQIEGGLIQSMSRALKESVHWDANGVTSRDWKGYPIVTFAEVPEIEIVLSDRPEEKAVGAGEPAAITAAPSLANAIFAAVGVRVREIPITAARIKAGLLRT